MDLLFDGELAGGCSFFLWSWVCSQHLMLSVSLLEGIRVSIERGREKREESVVVSGHYSPSLVRTRKRNIHFLLGEEWLPHRFWRRAISWKEASKSFYSIYLTDLSL